VFVVWKMVVTVGGWRNVEILKQHMKRSKGHFGLWTIYGLWHFEKRNASNDLDPRN